MSIETFKNLSLLNFAEAEAREKTADAISRVQKKLGRIYGLPFGQVISESQRSTLKSLNPSRPEEVVGMVELASVEDCEKALQVVHKGSESWRRVSPDKRADLVAALGSWMEKNRYDLSAWMTLEVGKTWREADADTCEAVDFCFYYASEMRRLAKPRVTQVVKGELDTLEYRPKGVAVVIAPWNFPLAILTGMTVAALVAGNTVIIKPAEQSSVIAAFLAQGLKEVGFPEDSFFFLPGEGEVVGPRLVSDSRVDLIAFTGSADVGLSIIESAARKPKENQRGVKKVIAEMGGKNALIVDEDADLDEAIVGAVHSAFGFQGQKCSALSRLLVHSQVYDIFVKRFIDAVATLKVGDPLDPSFQIGPVIDAEAQSRILSTIADGKKRMKVLFEYPEMPKHGYYVPPTIFESQDAEEPWLKKEIFGPVVIVRKFDDLKAAIQEVNSVPYALTGGIYSRSPSHLDLAKREMEVGNLYINRAITGAVVERHPFGGFKMSGMGSKAGGPDYLLQFMEPRTISENTVRRGFAG